MAGRVAKRLGLASVEHVICVASGKGGVGKSTTAVNLAVALATQLGVRTGLLDADIHGPSIPTMMNLAGEPATAASGLMLPLQNHGVACMSMGFFMAGDAPVVWRGPVVHSALQRFLTGTDWGALDVLVVDMPPGTGDAQISLGQSLPLSGALIVSTPQEVALLDARRGAQMFRKVSVPLMGLVETMSAFTCPCCGTVSHIFGEGGVQRAAQDLGLQVLGQVPIDPEVRITSDAGAPVVISRPGSASAQAYIGIASRVWESLQAAQAGGGAGSGPTITVS